MSQADAPSRKSITAHDVARLAGVSQSAVSRAFTEGAKISEDRRARVLEAARALGYSPDPLARSMKTRRSRLVGVVAGNLENVFFPQILERLSARLAQNGYRLLLLTASSTASIDAQIGEILSYRLDALVMLSTSLSPDLASQCRAAGLPVIYLNRVADAVTGAFSVTGENTRGAQAVAEHLVSTGRKRLAYLAGLAASLPSAERGEAFYHFVLQKGLPAPIIAECDFTRDGAKRAVRALLSRATRPDAIFCANDHMAITAIDVAQFEFGLRVGPELAIAGFNDVPMASWPSFDLTTFSQPVEPMVDAVVAKILDPTNADREHSPLVVSGALIVRGSTRPAD